MDLRRREFLVSGLAGGATLALGAGLAACGSSGTPKNSSNTTAAKVANPTLSYWLYFQPTSYFPGGIANGGNETVEDLIFDSLFSFGDQAQLIPRLAIDLPTVSPDAMTFTFKLRKGVVWSDGTPFTSKDVLYTYNMFANVASGSAIAGEFTDVVGADAVAAGTATTVSGFEAPDDYTFVIRTTTPDYSVPVRVGTYYIVPKHVFANVPIKGIANNSFFTTKPTVGTGPFTFFQYKPDQYFQLNRNPKYWRTTNNIDRVYLKPVTSEVAVNDLGSGALDITAIEPVDVATVKGMSNVKILSRASTGDVRLAPNQTQARFKDARVRQALLYGVDRKALIQRALFGYGYVPNATFRGSALPSGLNTYDYNPTKAKALLTAAGWDFSQTVKLSWVPGESDRDTAAVVVQAQMANVGFKIQLVQQDAPTFLADLGKREYDIILYGGGNYETDPYLYYPYINPAGFPPNGSNEACWDNPQFADLMNKANGTVNTRQRTALYQQAARMENADAPYIWLYVPSQLWGYNTRVAGFNPSGQTGPGAFSGDFATLSLLR